MRYALIAAILLLPACGGAQTYRDTDVVKPYGMGKPITADVTVRDGVLETGLLVYQGSRDLQDLWNKVD